MDSIPFFCLADILLLNKFFILNCSTSLEVKDPFTLSRFMVKSQHFRPFKNKTENCDLPDSHRSTLKILKKSLRLMTKNGDNYERRSKLSYEMKSNFI